METKPRKRITRAALKRSMRIFRYILPYKWPFIIGLLCLVTGSVSSLFIFTEMGAMIDITQDNFIQRSLEISMFIAVVLVIQAVTGYLRIYTFAIVTEKSVARIRQDVYSHLLALPMSYFGNKRVGELSSRIASDISSIKDTLTTFLAELIRQLIIIIGSVVILGLTSIKLALFMLATIPILAVFAMVFGRMVRKLSKKTQQQVAEATTIVEETLQGIAAVKAFTGELFEMTRYRKKTEEIIVTGMKNSVYRGLFAAFILIFIFASVVSIVWFGSRLVNSGEITTGELFQFFLLSVFMAGSVGGLAETYSQIQKAVGATENLLDILDEKPEYASAPPVRQSEKLYRGHIHFSDVSFVYPSKQDFPVLHHVDFMIEAGQQLAIVGPSGAGKSTITSLLLRFYDPTSGAILVDGKDIREQPLHIHRSQLALVPQDIVLFGGTIAENIRYGKPNATADEIDEAARLANAHEFIMEFPDGYDTLVGERGTKLSGGQRQRIAIARAILSDPAILLLDEATSSLDSESEHAVQSALETLMKGRTSIVIAHRLSTIKNADKIMVLDKGAIREIGTHDELLRNENGLYRYLVQLQSLAGMELTDTGM